MFKKVLVANRGEIAVRVMRTLKEMGIRTVTVFSDPDRIALHTLFADEAYPLGGTTSADSYLKGDKIIEIARNSGAEAIHPGYGFLSENADFAELCRENGVVFIGPPASAIRQMGDKVTSREIMTAAGVPVVPGFDKPDMTEKDALGFAEKAGFPVMIKASAGGGGKGMRKVDKAEDLGKALRAARSEALSSFGDGHVYVEKFVEHPRHIEIQILADNYGNVLYLGERDCSIQRRHQKVIEEAPSPFVPPEMRKKMGETAVQAARAAGYRNAGTVEFLVDKNHNFYFLEMNTRLQVEHPVTEWITGLDLVAEQVRIAAGELISLKQQDVKLQGHAVECRIYAEDPDNNFMPSPGTIQLLRTPAGPGIRDDSGIYEGGEISLYYDPLLSKLTAYGPDRDSAIRRMCRALDEYIVAGIKTNIEFHHKVLNHPEFAAGDHDTTFVSRHLDELTVGNSREKSLAVVAAAIHYYLNNKPVINSGQAQKCSQWKHFQRSGWL
ncbi:MAG: acetyl-CoA carboxylase biotin carboxylase subunit [Acidobacteria bacterium]|nr:acetyl-CoA carboxylase biotin carboxylase subunit [Acidobacteriota bacterium]